jgi:RimJ/RimL family protein N-acetyltransferase
MADVARDVAVEAAGVPVHVRVATAEDIEAILDLFEAVAAEGRWLGTEPGFDREERRQRLLVFIEGEQSRHLVAVAGERVIGHLSLVVAPYGVADLGMCVDASWRGRGVGTALVAEAIATARNLGAHKVGLQVWPHNEPARRLYRRHGFVEEGRLRRHYRRRNGELWDAVIMGLVLDEETPGSPYPDDAYG